jgi:hypothetical protein
MPAAARVRAPASAAGRKRDASTPYGTTSSRSGAAPSLMARVARSALHAVTAPARWNTRAAAVRADAVRSATNTSEPCRLTTSGSAGRAAAAIAPPGTTQCPCITVARRFCATRIALNHPAASASGAAIHAAGFTRTSACSPAA